MSTSTMTDTRVSTYNFTSPVVLLSIRTSTLGQRKQTETKTDENRPGTADSRVEETGSLVLRDKRLQAIARVDTAVRARIKQYYCLPFPMDGIYLLPVALIDAVYSRLEDAKSQRDSLVSAFSDYYYGLPEDVRQSIFGPFVRPGVDVTKYFRMAWSCFEIAAPSTGNARLDAEELRKAEAMWAEASAQVADALTIGMSELVDHAVDRLGFSEDGKPRVFRDTFVPKMMEFLETFRNRNITGDTQLQELADKAKDLLAGMDNDALRREMGPRKRILDGFQQIKEQLDSEIISRPGRRLKFVG